MSSIATCLPRLLDMSIEPFLIASTVRVVIGQRLVRRLNKERSESYQPSDDEMKQLEKTFGLESKADWQKVMKLVNVTQEAFGLEKTSEPTFYKPKAVKDDEQAEPAYKGRMGIYEVLENSVDIQKLIMANATSEDIQNKAIEQGMVTMQLDGLIKAMCGLTTIEEILRVTRE